jgi:hypothetical protein
VAQVLLPMPRLTAQRGAAHALSLRTIERSLSALAAARAECWARCAVRALSEILPRLPTGLSARDWHVAWYLSPAVPGGEVESGAPMIVRQRWRAEERWFDAPRLRALSRQILDRIAGHHREAPSELGLTLSSLMVSLSASDRLVLAPVSLERLIAEGSVRRVGDRLAQPEHRPRADPQDERFWLQVEPELSQERSISIHELADRLVMTPEAITEALERQARLGRVVRVALNRYLTLARFEGLLEQARDLAAQGRLSAAEFNRATALGRNLTIEVLETFDRLRYTRRLGGLRLMNGS